MSWSPTPGSCIHPELADRAPPLSGVRPSRRYRLLASRMIKRAEQRSDPGRPESPGRPSPPLPTNPAGPNGWKRTCIHTARVQCSDVPGTDHTLDAGDMATTGLKAPLEDDTRGGHRRHSTATATGRCRCSASHLLSTPRTSSGATPARCSRATPCSAAVVISASSWRSAGDVPNEDTRRTMMIEGQWGLASPECTGRSS